jgi:molybdenum cofactor synthesis domain-containing protein
MIRARVITCSDSVNDGLREDRSGPAVRELLEANGYSVDRIVVAPDDVDVIGGAILRAIEQDVRLIVTTGGTGIGPRDFTPEATNRVCQRVVPGFGELMRAASLRKTPMAALSRAQAATVLTALVVNVPGSVAGAVENLSAVLHLLPHALELLAGKTEHDEVRGSRGE